MDLGGKTVVPGFVDAHTHITFAGMRSSHVNLESTRSVADVKQALRQALPRYGAGQWVRGYGWDESFWAEKRYLTATDLDEVSTEKPIAIDRVDGHLTSVNSLALSSLGIPLKQEGVIKDKKGKPTGVLRDIDNLWKKMPPSPEEIKQGVLAGCEIANRHGITTLVDNVPPGIFRYVRDCEQEELLSTRMVVNQHAEIIKNMVELGLTSGMGGPMVKIGGVKSFTDGSIGARTAALSEPYLDDKGNKGRMLMSKKEIAALIKKATKNGIQTVTHAIGDEAIESVISAFESLSESERSRLRGQRHRIEHAEMISESQIRRAVSLGLILSMQPNFVGVWQQKGGLYEQRLGPARVASMNMFRVALDNGARVCFGSDGMPYGPLYGIWSATTHPNPKVRLTVEEALRCYTMESAYSAFMEKTVGSLTEGKRADFAILSNNILTIPPDRIKDLNVEMTIVGGHVEYSATSG
jgi:predicted amidohydrolase YtcJ